MIPLFMLLVTPQEDITKSVADLASPRYTIREIATFKLSHCKEPRILTQYFNHKDPEVAARIKLAYEQCIEITAQSFEPVPNIDAYWYDHVTDKHEVGSGMHGRLYPYVEIASKSITNHHERWPVYTDATRLYIRDKLRSGVNVQELRFELAVAHYKDYRFIRRAIGLKDRSIVNPVAYVINDIGIARSCLIDVCDMGSEFFGF